MDARMTAVAAAAVVAFSGLAASATTITPNPDPTLNEVDINFTSTGADVDLGEFDLFDSPFGAHGSFSDLNVDGSVRFSVYSSGPLTQGAEGSINLNFTQEDGSAGNDNESFSGTAGGLPLNFSLVSGDMVAEFLLADLGTSPASATEFFLDFSGFDPGDQFQANAARTVVPLPASLPLLLAALGGLGYLGRRRMT